MALDALTHIVIDVATQGVIPVIRAVQEDIRSRFVEIELLENGEPLTLPAGTTGTIGIRRPNSTYVLYDEDEDGNAAVDFADNVATCYLSQAALGMAGTMYANLVLKNGTTTLTAFAFYIDVEMAAVPSGAVPETYINILQQEYEYAAGVVAAAQDVLGDCQTEAGKAKTEADRAETYANGNQYPISYKVQQTLTTSEQEQARENISAASTTHASTHATGGTDYLSPSAIGAAAVSDLDNYINISEKGAVSGVAMLDTGGKVLPDESSSAYLPQITNITVVGDTYAGKTILCNPSFTVSLGAADDGTEVELWNTSSAALTVYGTVFIAGEGAADSVTILAYSVAVAKYMNSVWYVAGGVSV